MKNQIISGLKTEDGSTINTDMNYSYLSKRTNLEDFIGYDLKLPSLFNTIEYPSKSLGLDLSLSNLENEFFDDSILRCGILNQITENISSLVNSIKSSSLVTSTLCSNLENSANLPFESLFGFEITSTPFCLRNLFNLSSTFSSNRNLSLDWDIDNDILLTPSQVCCILQSCPDMLLGQRRECLKDFFDRSPIFQHLQNLPNHDSCAFESGLPMADFTVCYNIFVNFNSHTNDNDNTVYKFYDNKVKEKSEYGHMDDKNNLIKTNQKKSI